MFNKTLEKRFALSCFLSPVEGKWLNILGQQGGGCKVNGGIGKNFRIGGGGGEIFRSEGGPVYVGLHPLPQHVRGNGHFGLNLGS